MKQFVALFLLSGLLLLSELSVAHHSFSATFRADAPIEVTGVVTKFSFKNPHVLLYLDVTNEDGSLTSWVSEASAATNLRRTGWSSDTLKKGDHVRIQGDSSHDGSPMISMESAYVLNADGSVANALKGEESDTGGYTEEVREVATMSLTLEDGRPNLTGSWTGGPYPPPRDPPVPFNEAGRAYQAAYDEKEDPQVFCDRPGLIRQAGMTPHLIKMTQYQDRVAFQYEEYGYSREVFFDRTRAISGVKSHFGDSLARYEDGALIIDTINLLGDLSTPEGNRLSDQTTVTQVYKRVDEPEHGPMILIETTTRDPVYLADDFVLTNIKVSAGDYVFIENECIPPLRERNSVHPAMNFFLTSVGMGDGANLGGLEGADAHCAALAANMGQGDQGDRQGDKKEWRAYLSTVGEGGVDARDRIGSGPWYNAEGEMVAVGLTELHGEAAGLTKASVMTERADAINGRGDDPNRHDILTGSQMSGRALNSDTDTTCNNWTSNGEGSALVGHFDRVGGGANPTSWNQAHASRGCSQSDLQESGGDGLFYCFALDAH